MSQNVKDRNHTLICVIMWIAGLILITSAILPPLTVWWYAVVFSGGNLVYHSYAEDTEED
jgi:uncharacterized Tic20 family protein